MPSTSDLCPCRLAGPEVISRALAQLAAKTITRVVFSYGWAAYAVNALASVCGVDGRRKAGVPARDWIWYSGFFVMLDQITISAIPLAIGGDWAPIVITVLGTTLSLLQGAVSQWLEEKWAYPTTDLLTVGLVGMTHNLVAAGASRDPSTLGIHLNQIDIITDSKVSGVLRKTEDRYPLVGSSLISVFFPGGMRVNDKEKEFWSKAESIRQTQGLSKLAIKLD
ncbi:hypothetical protein M434DRAFT_13853 [Hypoxylon sp. CO27-5]|nr:hypothetical protein M434DRAFT_13853 [Hypoxylon sp. CO27-5]